MTGRLGLTDVMPVVSGGRYPARAVVGEAVPIAATVFGEGHALVAATVAWRGPEAARGEAYRMVPGAAGTDRWHAVVVPAVQGRWSFVVEAWRDPLSTWQHDVETKLDAGQGLADLANDMEDGARLLTRALRGLPRERRPIVTAAIAALRDDGRELAARIGPSLAPDLVALLQRFPVRELLTRSRRYELWVDRERALYGAWYELFPRSTGGVDAAGKPVHGTFLTTAERLPDIAAMGFDIVYLPPVHPIGVVNRKGANN
ncbi:MAG: alpha-1,4-glucan--maltose-1-phosphate maltosyltransferase, partial [Pseudonocardiales bacterium]